MKEGKVMGGCTGQVTDFVPASSALEVAEPPGLYVSRPRVDITTLNSVLGGSGAPMGQKGSMVQPWTLDRTHRDASWGFTGLTLGDMTPWHA